MQSQNTINFDFPPEAEDELLEFLDSQDIKGIYPFNNKTESLRRLVAEGEGRVDIPRKRINLVKGQLTQLGI